MTTSFFEASPDIIKPYALMAQNRRLGFAHY